MSSVGVRPPLVSVVVPSFNEDPNVVRASLDSICKQSFSDFECLVVDESTRPELAQACLEICEQDPRFIYLRPKDRVGLAGSLNLAMSQARGSFIARFDSDDICMPQRLADQVSFLLSHPDISVVGGGIDIINDQEEILACRFYPLDSVSIEKRMQFTTAIAHPTVMFRREAFEICGGYNPEYRFAEDLELWLRWLNAGMRFANLPQIVVQYRQNDTQRNRLHWRFNLRARIDNFSMNNFVRRTFGIACIATWAILPKAIQGSVFKAVNLHRRSQGVLP